MSIVFQVEYINERMFDLVVNKFFFEQVFLQPKEKIKDLVFDVRVLL